VRVLDSSAVAVFSTLQRTFDPLSEQIFVNELRVEDPDGKTVATGKLSDYYVLDERSEEMASHRKVLNVPVAGLRPGFRLVATITRLSLGKLDEFPFYESSFSHGYPVRESLVLLRGDAKGLKFRSRPEVEPEKLAEGLVWRQAEPLVVRYEPLQPKLATFAPMLWMADAASGWRGVVTGYLASIADRLEPDTNVVKLTREILATTRDERDRIRALAEWVQTNCTYKAIEFGRRARIPNKPADVVKSRFGDCKDHATMLQQMLLAAGTQARLALVNHSSPIEQDLPSLDQFDHMIVFVPGEKGLFIDPTDKGSDPGSGSPAGLEQCAALILDETNPRFATIPGEADGQSRIEIQRKVRLTDQEGLTEETIIARGTPAAYLRNYLQALPVSTRRTSFQEQMGLADMELAEFTAEPLELASAPLRIRLVYSVRKQFHRTPERISGALRAAIERDYLGTAPVERRLTPFEIRTPLSVRSVVSVEIPEGFSMEPPATTAVNCDPRFAVCTNAWRVEGRNLVGQFECRKVPGKFNNSEYGRYRETMAHALSLVERELVFVASPRPAN